MVPPFTVVAVKLTMLPSQTAPEGEAAKLTLTGTVGVMFIVIVLEVAGDPVAQGAVAVMMQLTWSPVESELLE